MIDTHCHIHSKFFPLDAAEVLKNSRKAGVKKFMCVGVDAEDSKLAVKFAQKHDDVWAVIGIHPHEASKESHLVSEIDKLAQEEKVVAIGEIGLDYWYEHSPRELQQKMLRDLMHVGKMHNLPFVFHVRGSKQTPNDAFNDFFEILQEFPGTRGVVHSFTAGQSILKGVLSKSLKVGVNGIATFSKDEDAARALKEMSSSSFVLETDAPFLTPVPKRGIVNTPEYMGYTAKYLAELRGESLEQVIAQTTRTAEELFGI